MTLRAPTAVVLALTVIGCATPATQASGPLNVLPESLQALTAPVASASARPASPMASPEASASPSPTPSPGKLDPDWKKGEVYPFEARRRLDDPQHDLFVYNARMDRVFELVGANTPFDEILPVITDDKQWVVYQQNRPGGPNRTHSDVLLFNTVTQRRYPLQDLNTEAFNETAPTIDGAGTMIAYVSDEGGRSTLRLYDLLRHLDSELPIASRLLTRLDNPAFSGDGKKLAFSAVALSPSPQPSPSPGLSPGQRDIYVYEVDTGRLVLLPPPINTAFDEDFPALNEDGSRAVFSSNRHGTFDIFELNLTIKRGVLDNLAFANTPDFDETVPAYLPPDRKNFAFRVTVPGGDLEGFVVRRIERPSERLDTRPTLNQLLLPAFLAQLHSPSPSASTQ